LEQVKEEPIKESFVANVTIKEEMKVISDQ